MEWLRLVRTRRLIAVAGTYLFFGLLGPVTARYLEQLLTRFGGGVGVDLPDPVPADGIAQFSSNAQQIGLLVALGVAAGALALDGNPAMAAFLRTRVQPVWRLLVPRYVLAAGLTAGGFTLGAVAAWYQSGVLLGPLPAAGMAAGIGYGWLYLCFALSVLATAATIVRSRMVAVIWSVVALLMLPLVGLLPAVGRWLPSALVGTLDELAAGGAPGDYLRAAATTVVLTAVLLVVAAVRLGRREI
jgi:ABC-2 type transport system permease protein